MTVYEGNIKPSSIEQATLETDLSAVRITEISSNQQFRADYNGLTDGLPKYTGAAPKGLAEGTDGWLLKEFTYDANRQCTKILIAYGNWTARSSGSYS
jgi:hypothetical protein